MPAIPVPVKEIRLSTLQLMVAVMALLSPVAIGGFTDMANWSKIPDRLLTQEVRNTAKWESQSQRDNRQDADLLRTTQDINKKFDSINMQLKFITEEILKR